MAAKLRVAVEHPHGRIVVTDSLTYCDAGVTAHDVVVAGSFAGAAAFALAYEHGARAIIAHAAGVGKERAGISGLADANSRGIAAAAVETMSARIGDGDSVWRDGRIAYLNDLARALGVAEGMAAEDAARRLLSTPPGRRIPNAVDRGQRTVVDAPEGRVALMLSTSFLTPAHARDVVCAGSHGARVNMLPVFAAPPRGVIVFDGGMARERSGIEGLVWLDDQPLAGAAVASDSACIGDPESAWATGTLSFVNRTAAQRGLVTGITVRDAARRLLGRDA